MRNLVFALVLALSAGCAGVDLPVDSPAEMVDRADRWNDDLDELQKRLHGANVLIEAACRVPATAPNCDVLYGARDLARDKLLPRARQLVETYRTLGVGGDQIDAALARIAQALSELEALVPD